MPTRARIDESRKPKPKKRARRFANQGLQMSDREKSKRGMRDEMTTARNTKLGRKNGR